MSEQSKYVHKRCNGCGRHWVDVVEENPYKKALEELEDWVKVNTILIMNKDISDKFIGRKNRKYSEVAEVVLKEVLDTIQELKKGAEG